MRKLIITSIFIITTLNAFAINCTRYLFDIHEKANLNDGVAKGMKSDSVFIQYRDTQHSTEYEITKYYWTVDQYDSAITYRKKHNSDEWEITVYRPSDSSDSHLEITLEGNIVRYFYTGKSISTENLIYDGKDSVNHVTKYIDSETGEVRSIYEDISILRNDTIYKSANNGKLNYITFLDSADENKCYMMTGDNYEDIEAIYEFKMRGDTLIEIETMPGGYQSTFMAFYIPDDKTTSIITRKTRPTFKRQKAKPFDLLGRPAKGKYTVKVLK